MHGRQVGEPSVRPVDREEAVRVGSGGAGAPPAGAGGSCRHPPEPVATVAPRRQRDLSCSGVCDLLRCGFSLIDGSRQAS